MKTLVKKIDWKLIVIQCLSIFLMQHIVLMIWAHSLVFFEIVDVEENIPTLIEYAGILLMVAMYVSFSYWVTSSVNENRFLHTFLVITSAFFISIIVGYAFHANVWHDYLIDISFTYGTMLAGYAIWHEKTHRTVRRYLTR